MMMQVGERHITSDQDSIDLCSLAEASCCVALLDDCVDPLDDTYIEHDDDHGRRTRHTPCVKAGLKSDVTCTRSPRQSL